MNNAIICLRYHGIVSTLFYFYGGITSNSRPSHHPLYQFQPHVLQKVIAFGKKLCFGHTSGLKTNQNSGFNAIICYSGYCFNRGISYRTNWLIPPEQYSEQQSTDAAEDGNFDKVLQGNISSQRRLPMCIISADAANCHDKIHHAIIALVFLCIGVYWSMYRRWRNCCDAKVYSADEVFPLHWRGWIYSV